MQNSFIHSFILYPDLSIPSVEMRLATSFNTVKGCPTMLDPTMLDDGGSVWPGLKNNAS